MFTKPKKELLKIAQDINEGRIFGTWMYPKGLGNSQIVDRTLMTFPSLKFLKDEALEELEVIKPVHFWAYKNKVAFYNNSTPCFFEANFFTRDDWEYIVPVVNSLKDSKDKVLEKFKNED